ncbi:uncharacterized protein LOC143292574 [Babylonia areolata]|uniref:uncharacterized protein LOC143292574 n=1 Tax=Babylonia areolata TaxID=304850 RepID=UPI003FD16E00
MIKTRNNTNAPTGYINNGVSSSFSNKQKCEHSDLITKFRKNRCTKSSFFNKRTYDIKTETHEFGHVTPTPLDDCNDILGLSLTERRDCELHTSALPADNDCGGVASQGAKHQKRENHSRQLTLMPLLASLTFVTLSAPLAVMLVAEHTVWVRNTAEQVALYTLLRLVANTLMYVNHSVNFLLYCFAGTTFRRHCCQLLCKVCCRLCPRHHRCRSSSQSCCVPAS